MDDRARGRTHQQQAAAREDDEALMASHTANGLLANIEKFRTEEVQVGVHAGSGGRLGLFLTACERTWWLLTSLCTRFSHSHTQFSLVPAVDGVWLRRVVGGARGDAGRRHRRGGRGRSRRRDQGRNGGGRGRGQARALRVHSFCVGASAGGHVQVVAQLQDGHPRRQRLLHRLLGRTHAVLVVVLLVVVVVVFEVRSRVVSTRCRCARTDSPHRIPLFCPRSCSAAVPRLLYRPVRSLLELRKVGGGQVRVSPCIEEGPKLFHSHLSPPLPPASPVL